jgi:Spy/CpxP family protein refolding chaperone
MNFKTVRQSALSASIAALFLCAGSLSADMGMKDHMGMGGMKMEKMDKDLGLSKDQKAKMKALHEKNAETMKALHAKMSDDAKRLDGLVQDKASDAVLAAATSEVIADHRLVIEAQMTHQDSMQSILSTSQYAKVLVKMCDDMPGMGDKDDDEHKTKK